jgi:uncharacterized protein
VRVIVTGSSGFIGTALVAALEQRGDTVTRLVRRAAGHGEVQWDPAGGTVDPAALEGHDGVVNLAGAGIGDKRWNTKRKHEIIASRELGTLTLTKALASLDRPPAVLASGSAVGVYGPDRGDEILTEESAPGDGFLAGVAHAWEAATAPAEQAGIRTVHLRTGLVLGRDGGLLSRLLIPFRLGVGGRIGSGRQWMSWIAMADEVGAIMHVLDNDVRGPVNLTAPAPVTNQDMTKVIGRVLGRPTFVPVPAAALRVALGSEMAAETALASQRVIPAKLTASGYAFVHEDVETALRTAVS